MRLGGGGKVLAQPLCAQLAGMQPGTDSSYRGNTISCQFSCEPTAARSPSGSVTGTSSCGPGAAADARAPRMTIIKSSLLEHAGRPPVQGGWLQHCWAARALPLGRHVQGA